MGNKININWYPGHMIKTKKEIIGDLKLINVVIEILDARIPISSQNPEMQKIIRNKKRIIILNKSDLAEDKETKKWVEFYKRKGIKAIIADSNLGKGIKETFGQIEKIMKEDIQKSAIKGRVNKNIRVMILGIPNVGKSSFINRLCNKKVANVENKPGITKQKQWVRISNNIELLDTPGVLCPKLENKQIALNLSYIGSIKDEVLQKVEIAFNLLQYLYNNYKINLLGRYKLTENELEDIECEDKNKETYSLMKLIGKKRGAIISGGNVDEEKIANIILNDFKNGKIGRITLEKVYEK